MKIKKKGSPLLGPSLFVCKSPVWGCNPSEIERARVRRVGFTGHHTLSIAKHRDCDRLKVGNGIANLPINPIYDHRDWRKASEHIVELRHRLDHRINYISIEIGI